MTQIKPAFRIETDTLGQVQVPVSAYYGAQTQRAIENFPISGKKPCRAFIWSVAVIKRAAAEVNASLGLLDQTLSDAIIQAAEEVMQGKWDDQFLVDPFQAGAGTSHNMNANEVIANRAAQLLGGEPGEYKLHPNDHVNMAQSTNDVIPAAIRLGCLWRLDEMLAVLRNLSGAFQDKAVQFDDIVKSGRTHLQDAAPIRLGQEFGAYARTIERDIARIERAAEGLLRLGIGGAAVGSGLNVHPEYPSRMVQCLSRLTGFRLSLSDNLFESMQSMADLVDFSAAMRTLALTLIRIANDIRLLSSGPFTGLDEIRLPAVQPGSSIMPGKVNPVMAEMLDMAMYHIIGCDTAVMLASQAGQLELNVMMPVIAHNLFEIMQIMTGAVRAFTTKCVVGIQANPEKIAGWLSRNPIIVTALNPLIGYAAGARLVKEAAQSGRSVKEIAVEKAQRGELKNTRNNSLVSPNDIEKALGNLRALTEGGIHTGLKSGGG
jgi:fumarate hydratase class II